MKSLLTNHLLGILTEFHGFACEGFSGPRSYVWGDSLGSLESENRWHMLLLHLIWSETRKALS